MSQNKNSSNNNRNSYIPYARIGTQNGYPGPVPPVMNGSPQQPNKRPGRRPNWKRIIPVLAAGVLVIAGVITAVSLLGKDKAERTSANGNVVFDTREEKTEYDRKAAYVDGYRDRFADNIIIDGVNIGGMNPDEAVQALQENYQRAQTDWNLSITFNGHTFITLDKGSLGYTYDSTQVNNAINETFRIGKSGDVEEDYTALMELQTQPRIVDTFFQNDNGMLDLYLAQIEQSVNAEPVNAYIVSFSPDENDPFVIQPQVSGRRMNVEETKRQILNRAESGRGGSLSVVVDPVPAQVSAADLRKRVSLISEWSTRISTSSSESRTGNIILAFSKINGTILKSGESFSFNKVAGTRTKKNGYQEAPAYAYNETVMEVGGGVCQASSTLYMAARLANLRIDKRSPHSMQVNYTEYGLDATVNSTGKIIDFQFTNTTGSELYIACRVETSGNKKTCVVKLYGEAFEEGVSYKMRTEEIETIWGSLMDPEIRKDKDYTHGAFYEDEQVLYKEAKDGHVVVAYLQKWQNGILLEENQVTKDTYPAQAAIYYVGTHKLTDPLPEQ